MLDCIRSPQGYVKVLAPVLDVFLAIKLDTERSQQLLNLQELRRHRGDMTICALFELQDRMGHLSVQDNSALPWESMLDALSTRLATFVQVAQSMRERILLEESVPSTAQSRFSSQLSTTPDSNEIGRSLRGRSPSPEPPPACSVAYTVRALLHNARQIAFV